MHMASRRAFGAALGAASLLGACGRRSNSDYEPGFSRPSSSPSAEYSFAVHPLHNPVMLYRTFSPLMAYLGERAGARFHLITSRDYASFEARLLSGRFDFALTNPYQTLRSLERGYRVFAKETDDDQFRGLVVVRTNSTITSPEDLVGKTISYPAPTAVAATLMVQYFLQTHGLPISRTRSIYVGSLESSISSVYLGASEAGGTWIAPWGPFVRENPKIGSAVKAKWRTESLVNNGLVALKSVPHAITDKVAESLLGLGAADAGKAMLSAMWIPGFEPAGARSYEPVREFISRYEAAVGPIHARS